ncbi:MlaC/ttg2D family ABC transporter substrate-binding protein [Palleronia sp. KMU-117]|uniref:MlaC/ttg2D family ABC transporter substrate-binding protein n=1 Tax=Palleronia sp. KMU-117 TaxID=3434108 RepID=UPI003D73FDE8
MTRSTTNRLSRRQTLALAAGAACLAALPARALTTAQARQLIDGAVADINAIIGSGKSEAGMYRDFEQVFARYADVPTIARFALGPTARSASPAELSAFTKAFQGYMARKYGKRFREFQGTRIEVVGAREVKSFFEVQAIARTPGQSPYAVSFMVSDRSGANKFFDMLIEGVSLIKTEQTEIGAMLDRRGGSIAKLAQDLQSMG